MLNSCAECRHFHAGTGTCRRYPPEQRPTHPFGVWPLVKPDWSCGEYIYVKRVDRATDEIETGITPPPPGRGPNLTKRKYAAIYALEVGQSVRSYGPSVVQSASSHGREYGKKFRCEKLEEDVYRVHRLA